jgi:hypothetical protein
MRHIRYTLLLRFHAIRARTHTNGQTRPRQPVSRSPPHADCAQRGQSGRVCPRYGRRPLGLSQFLDPDIARLPRAETLRAIAAAKGVTTDWLLGLAKAAEGGQEIARSVEIETAEYEDGGSPLQRWRREALGAKLRYVPSTLPDMLRLPEVMFQELEGPRAEARLKHAETVLDDALLGDLDIEIAMAFQAFEDFARGRRHLGRSARRDAAPAARLHGRAHGGELSAAAAVAL